MKKAVCMTGLVLLASVVSASVTLSAGYYSNWLYQMWLGYGQKHEENQLNDFLYAEAEIDTDWLDLDVQYAKSRQTADIEIGYKSENLKVMVICSGERFMSESISYSELEIGMLAELSTDIGGIADVRMYGKAAYPFIKASTYSNGNATDYSFDKGTFAVAMGCELALWDIFHVGAEIESYQYKINALSYRPVSIKNTFLTGLTIPIGQCTLSVQWEHLCQHPEIVWWHDSDIRFNRAYNILTAGVSITFLT